MPPLWRTEFRLLALLAIQDAYSRVGNATLSLYVTIRPVLLLIPSWRDYGTITILRAAFLSRLRFETC